MPMTQSLQNKLLDATLGNVAYASPATVYVALYSTVNTPTTAGTELSGDGYARQSATFSAANVGVIASNVAVTFTSTGNAWVSAVSVGITDASTAGNVLYYQNGAVKAVPAGETLTFATGEITVSIT
jgi:hypothetical protein